VADAAIADGRELRALGDDTWIEQSGWRVCRQDFTIPCPRIERAKDDADDDDNN
jgi:hypothetical protein